jgi:hypothetical protein
VPFVDLSQGVPVGAKWIKVRFSLRTRKPAEPLIARIWSGNPAKAVVVKGPAGDAFIKLEVPQTLSYDHADGLDLSLKVVAYKLDDSGAPPAEPG